MDMTQAKCRSQGRYCLCWWIFQAVVCGVSHVCRAGVWMCWHLPLVLLDEAALAAFNFVKGSPHYMCPPIASSSQTFSNGEEIKVYKQGETVWFY